MDVGADAGGLMTRLEFVSLMSENALPFCHGVASFLSGRLGLPVELASQLPWQDAERRLYRGEAHLGVVCGLQYVLSADRGDVPGVEVLVAPVMRGARYEDRPVYFSDVIVRRDHRARRMADLRGCTWAFNEPTSHSGYALPRSALADLGFRDGFFGRVICAGSHLHSLELLLEGSVDATAIDSTVLEEELRRRPFLVGRIRVVEVLGPSPIPPLVVSRAVPAQLRCSLAHALLEMQQDAEGSSLLEAAAVKRFVGVTDSDYAPIRATHRRSMQVDPWIPLAAAAVEHSSSAP